MRTQSTHDEGAISEVREENVRQVDSPSAGIVCILLNTVGQQQRVLHYEGTDDEEDASLELMPSSFDMSMANSVCQGCCEENDPYDYYRNQILNIQQKINHFTSGVVAEFLGHFKLWTLSTTGSYRAGNARLLRETPSRPEV